MNVKERIDNLQKELDALKAELSETKCSKGKVWEPKEDEVYGYITANDSIVLTTFHEGNTADEERVKLGNCFKDVEDAVVMSSRMWAFLRLLKVFETYPSHIPSNEHISESKPLFNVGLSLYRTIGYNRERPAYRTMFNFCDDSECKHFIENNLEDLKLFYGVE